MDCFQQNIDSAVFVLTEDLCETVLPLTEYSKHFVSVCGFWYKMSSVAENRILVLWIHL